MSISRREALKRVGFLLGGAVALPTAMGVLGGCQADASPGWTPSTLSAEQNDLVTALSEHIIPETDTPGAKAAQVNRFIDEMLTQWYPDEVRTRFLDGLGMVEQRSREMFGQAFLESTRDEQVRLLTQLDEEAYPPRPAVERVQEEKKAEDRGNDRNYADENIAEEDEIATDSTDIGSGGGAPEDPYGPQQEPPFFKTMKEMTLLGYYTSEIGATEELQWLAVPGRYDGSITVSEVGRAWS